MTIALALEYIPRRMQDLGVGNNYFLRFRHFSLKANQTLELDGQNQFYIQLDEVADIKIESDIGIYDLSDPYITEHDYEHQGKITIWNYSSLTKHIRFIQIILKN